MVFVMVHLFDLNLGVVPPDLFEFERHEGKNSGVNHLSTVFGRQYYMVITMVGRMGLLSVFHLPMVSDGFRNLLPPSG